MLILFDIDLTLLTTDGSGMRAMLQAGRALHGPGFNAEGVSFAGRLDPLIIGDMFAASGVPDTPDHRLAFRREYVRHLGTILAASTSRRTLPGVVALLDALDAARDAHGLTLGLLTGNFEESGTLKLRACGLDPSRFAVRAWGDDSPRTPPRREDLVPVAMHRDERLRRRRLEPSRVVVIGDTPHDVRCALAHGCRSLAVATGRSGLDDLRAAGAHLAVPDLTDTRTILRWLTATDTARA